MMDGKKGWVQRPSTITRLFRKQGTGKDSDEVDVAPADAVNHVAAVSNANKINQSVEKTFRVRGIPLGITSGNAEQLIQDVLGCSKDESGFRLRSLATHHSGKGQDATISFNKTCPPVLKENLPYSNDPWMRDDSLTLTFDDFFLGLTTLSNCPVDEHQVNVIALTGIGAHAFRSFKNVERPHMWLRDELPTDLPGAHIMTWGYDATVSKSDDTKSIQDISRQLQHDLFQISGSFRLRPLIFVGHSLGGLVLKKLLVDLCNSTNSPSDAEASTLIDMVRGVIFFGVPHFGLETQVIKTLVQMAEKQPNEPLLHSIGQDSEFLDQLHKEYALLFSKTRFPKSITCSVYETRLSPTALNVDGKWAMVGPPALFVNKQSATAARRSEEENDLSIPIDETHSNLVKFPPRSQHYYRIVQVMKKCLAAQALLTYEHSLEEREFLQMLYPGDYKRYKNRNPDRVDGTCRWVLDHQLYAEWLQMNQSTLLWVSADPGCGKSVLAKALIDRDLVIPSDATLLYFFFKDDDKTQKSAAKAVAAFLHQLFSKPQQAFLIRHAMPDYRSMGEGLLNSFDSLWEVFVLAVSDPRAGPIYCVLDALDECEPADRKELLSILEHAFAEPEDSELGEKVKFIVTSRPYQDIERRFSFLIRLEGEKETKIIKKEIDRVIKHTVPELSKRLALDQRQQSLLQAKLLSVEHRTYLWLHLVLENLIQSNNFNRKKFDKIIEDLPRSVEAAYEKILSKGEKNEQDKLLELLQLIVVATRPLSVAELNLILPLQLNDSRTHKNFVDEELEPDDQFKKTMRNWCGLFLSVVDNLVYLLHQTARDFLIAKPVDNAITTTGWKNSVQLWKAEILMTQKCVAYLMFQELNDSSTELNPTGLQEHFGFFEYAARTWHYHFQKIQERWAHREVYDLLTAAYKLYDIQSRCFQNWSGICNENLSNDKPKVSVSQPIIVATDLGHHVSVGSMYRAGWDLEVTDGPYRETLLLRAVVRRHLTTLKALVELGANLEARNTKGETALIISIKNQSGGEMIQWLVDIGANLEAKDFMGKGALLHALEANSQEAVKILFKAGVDKESKDAESRSILSRLAESNMSQMVRILLSSGVDCDSEDRFGQTPLMWAAGSSSDTTDVMELLVSYSADVNKRNALGQTPLHLAFGAPNDAILSRMRILLRHNATAHVKDNQGTTPLGGSMSSSFPRAYPDIVRLLVSHGAEINAKERFGRTALCAFLRSSVFFKIKGEIIEETIRVMVSSGADIDVADDTGRTPLFWALEGGPPCLKLAETLLDCGANQGSRIIQGHSIEVWAERESSPAAEVDGVESLVDERARLRAADQVSMAPQYCDPESDPFRATQQWVIS